MNDALLHFIAIVTYTCRVRLNNQTWFDSETMKYRLYVALFAYHPKVRQLLQIQNFLHDFKIKNPARNYSSIFCH